jgi:hypothetical protein
MVRGRAASSSPVEAAEGLDFGRVVQLEAMLSGVAYHLALPRRRQTWLLQTVGEILLA